MSSFRALHCVYVTNDHRARRMRLGTFNVNGKMPSQDLSAWVQKSVKISEPKPVAPALPPEMSMSSSLSHGEAVRNSFPSRGLPQFYHFVEN